MSEETTAVDATGQGDTGSSDTTTQTDTPSQKETTETPSVLMKEATEEKPAETTEPEGAPESYELTSPEGYTPVQDAVDSFKKLAKELGLTAKQAQAIYGNYATTELAQNAAANEAHAQAVKDNIAAAKSHPEYGGVNFDKSVKLGDRVIKHFGGEGFSEFCEKSTLSSNPQFFEFVNNVAKVISDDVFVEGDAKGGVKNPGGLKDEFSDLDN